CAAVLAAALAISACSRSAPAEAPPVVPPVAEESAPPPLAGGPPAEAAPNPALAEAALVAGDTALASPAPAEPAPDAATPPAALQISYAEGYIRADRYGYDHRAQARERAIERQRYDAYQRWLRQRRAQHWRLRHHQLVFEHPVRGRLLDHYAPPHRHDLQPRSARAARPAAPHPARAHAARAHPANLVRPHRTAIEVRPTAKPVLLPQPAIKPLDHTLALPLIETRPTTPTPTPAQAAAAPAVDLTTQLGQLTSAAAEDMKGAKLDVPSALSTGGEGKVALTLPPDLLRTIQARASSSSLGPAARKVSVTAKLAGQGYAITPNGEQTARLQINQPAVFSWDVKPSGAAGGVLTADMTASLQGPGSPLTFALGAVTAQIPVVAPAAPVSAPAPAPVAAPGLGRLSFGAWRVPDLSRFGLPDLSRLRLRDLTIPGRPTLGVPGLGQVPSYRVVAAGLFALIVILLAAIARGASARRERAERRRRFHSFETADFGDEHP
ncbi:MAG TPA: hypothetical protein VIJ94_09480, partial [Caulobacteraceae bacterium]